MNRTEEVQTKYWAYEILSGGNKDETAMLASALSTSTIDLNPHQIEAALFALNTSSDLGVILADEVGLGKTIEAGIVSSEYFARGLKKQIVIAPANLCPQWQSELHEKFDLPAQIIDKRLYKKSREQHKDLFLFEGITILSYQAAVQLKNEISLYQWDLAIFDEAHKLRNLQKGDTKIAGTLFEMFLNTKKLLLTATPIQNSLLDIYSLIMMIDPGYFGSKYVFMDNYMYSAKRHAELKKRLSPMMHRTLRKDVLEYVKYTKREAMTIAFSPPFKEEELNALIGEFIQKKSKFAIMTRYRVLITLMMHKLMASSTKAIRGTLIGFKERLEELQKNINTEVDLLDLIQDAELVRCYRDKIEEIEDNEEVFQGKRNIQADLQEEIELINHLIQKADTIQIDAKTEKLLEGIHQGFAKMREKGGLEKVIIFTESQRTLDYLYDFLSTHGFQDKIVTYSGQNNSKLCLSYYNTFQKEHPEFITGNKTIDMKRALVDAFKTKADVMIATEAAAEGLNLQFCSLLVNYDLPWNPQRIEQRIGRVHRYGQKNDVVVINFINRKNVADVRVYEILQNKFKLFDGVFGASDEVLGLLADGVDFEAAVADIFEHCRTPEEINSAFDELQASMTVKIDEEMEKTRQLVLDHLTPTTQERLHVIKQNVEDYLVRSKDIFWKMTVYVVSKLHPEYFLNEKQKIFGPIEEQVFENQKESLRYTFNFSYQLNYSQREDESIKYMSYAEKKRLRRTRNYYPQPYNPTTDIGKAYLHHACQLNVSDGHFVVRSDKMPAQTKGRFMLTFCHTKTPRDKGYLIGTFISDKGGLLRVNANDFFDQLIEVREIQEIGFSDYLESLHQQEIEKYEARQKAFFADELKRAIENINRSKNDALEGLRVDAQKAINKLSALKRELKLTKNVREKIVLSDKIHRIEAQLADEKLKIFDKEKEIIRKYGALQGAKKRKLKYQAERKLVFQGTFEVI